MNTILDPRLRGDDGREVMTSNLSSQEVVISDTTPIYIAGPTGVGKSEFATLLALQLGGEIVGADAFQLYRGLPILTAQPSQAQQRVVPHHLIGTLSLAEGCDAARYRVMALASIQQIQQRGSMPIITGGTGFYIRSLILPLDLLPTADLELRASLVSYSHKELVAYLEECDPEAKHLIDLKNRRRVERALEIVIQSGAPLATVWKKKKESSPPAHGFFLFREREELYERIEKHVQTMFEHGVIEEVQALESITLSATASMALGLREIQTHLRGEISLPTTIEKIIHATKRYAKRQITWFKNQHTFLPWNLSDFSSMEEAVEKAAITLSLLKKKSSIPNSGMEDLN
ncbi:MAG: tRNA (adenosine(37)-N6)-dimethylallyltransferase MiaA [Chthoniobacterales bacterium]